MTTMREQYKYQRAVDAELARAVTKETGRYNIGISRVGSRSLTVA